MSSNGGCTFRHAAPPPAHLVAAAPYQYTPGTAIEYEDLSNVLLNRDGGFLYEFEGHCRMWTRAEHVHDLGPVVDPAAHVCEHLDIVFGPHFIGWTSFYAQYIPSARHNAPTPMARGCQG